MIFTNQMDRYIQELQEARLSQRDRATHFQLTSCQLVHTVKSSILKGFQRVHDLKLKVTQGHRKWRDSIGHISLLISGL